ncbi:MAG: serine hydrolase domain-containing protein [Bacteroidia bacterium]
MRSISLCFLLFATLSLQAQFEENFQPITDGDPLTVQAYMEQNNVSGFSFYADFGNGQDTAVLLGHRGDAGQTPMSLDTRFQVSSMGGAAICMAILHLVDQGKIVLDAPADQYLPKPIVDKRKKPDGPVTVRDLIIYRRDFKMNQKPKGYAMGEDLPTLEEVIAGNGPAKTDPITIRGNLNKDQNSQYGNILFLQQILEHHYKKPLSRIIDSLIFKPLGMDDSEFGVELSDEDEAKAAHGYLEGGKPIKGGYRRYPELGASGMWSTPRDFCKLVRHVMDAAAGKDNRLLSVELAKQGMTRALGHRSLIFHINDNGDVYWGGNAKGFFMSMQAWPEKGMVAVAACNLDLQWRLVNPAIYQTYNWARKHIDGFE